MFEEVDYARGLTNLEASVLVITHTVPCVLTADSKVLATIDVKNLTSDLVSMLRCQMDDSVADLFDFAGAPHRIGVLLFLHDGVVLDLGEASLPVEIGVKE